VREGLAREFVRRVQDLRKQAELDIADRIASASTGTAPRACWRPRLKLPVTCQMEGIFSHFANADAADLTSARIQLERFKEVLRFYERHSLPPRLCATLPIRPASLQLPDSYFDLVRPGILLYGVYPSPRWSKPSPCARPWRGKVTWSISR
jgi:alanine racemase